MTHLKQTLIFGALSLMAIAGCSSAPESTQAPTTASPAATTAPQKAADAMGDAKQKAADATGAMKDKAQGAADAMKDKAGSMKTAVTGFADLTSVVNNTKAAVEAGDFAKAKTEFGKFQGDWSKVADGVKAKSPDAYKAIEAGAGEVSSAIKAGDKAKALSALQAIGKNVLVASKG